VPNGYDVTLAFGEAGISGYRGRGGRPDIPRTVLGRPVIVIGWRAFYSNQLTSVTIPDSVVTIGNSAFEENKLTSVTIPNGVTSIGHYAFKDNKLIRVTIPNSVTSIGRYAFEDNELTSVIIPSSVTAIGGSAFASNPLTSITIGANVNLEAGAFHGNFADVYKRYGAGIYELEMHEFADNDYRLNKYAMYERLDRLGKVTWHFVRGEADVAIGDGEFAGKRLTAFTFPSNVAFIGDRAFANNKLTRIVIPNSVTSIGAKAFANNKLTSITLPANVKLGDDALPCKEVYEKNGKQAGTYVKRGNSWRKQ
jgi:hypothetical protein